MPFPKFEEWQAPWEKNKTEWNAETAKSLVYSLQKELAEGKERHATQLADVEKERDTHKAKVEELEAKDLSEVDKLKRENERLKEQKAKPAGDDLAVKRLELALEHGLTAAQARRLVGANAEELTADAKAYAEEISAKGGDSNGGRPPTQRPAAKDLRSGLGDGDEPEVSSALEALKLLPPRR